MSSFNYPEFLLSSPKLDSNQRPSHANNAESGNVDRRNSTNLDPTSNPTLPPQAPASSNPRNPPPHSGDGFDLLFDKLSQLEEPESHNSKSPTSRPINDLFNNQFYSNKDTFNLPLELQGGIGTISSRRPSYAAESFTRSNFAPLLSNNNMLTFNQPPQSNNYFNNTNNNTNPGNITANTSKNLSSFAMMNNYNQNFNFDQFNDSFANFNLNANLNDFQARRPSQLVDFQSQQPQHPFQYQQQQHPFPTPPNTMGNSQPFIPNHLQQQQQQPQQPHQPQQQQQQQQNKQVPLTHPQQINQNNPYVQAMKLENGLMLKDQYIVASSDLKNLYSKTIKYFQNPVTTKEIVSQLHNLLTNQTVLKLIAFIKNLNNLTFNHKILCLVINKNGKFDLLSYPNNSNIFLQREDLVIVDGDRGKDLVMIVEPLVNLNFAILFNFLKKLEHLKSLTIQDSHQGHSGKTSGTHSTLSDASTIINSHLNEDNEFIITLPTKQVLRFATPKEVHKISGKFLEEKKAFITCYNKIKELNLQKSITLINVEYQSDFKKLIFYYFANFKRIDFRGLIKELFKIYKTRIWLCAVLPHDRPELYATQEDAKNKNVDTNERPQELSSSNQIPHEYELSNDQILNFSINEFDNLSSPNYFHLANLLNLINHLNKDIEGYFYGFNIDTKSTKPASTTTKWSNAISSEPPQPSNAQSGRRKIVPNFNPFGDN